jgi:hypothetical protein
VAWSALAQNSCGIKTRASPCARQLAEKAALCFLGKTSLVTVLNLFLESVSPRRFETKIGTELTLSGEFASLKATAIS